MNDSQRLEKKFVANNATQTEVEIILRKNIIGLRELFSQRRIKSIYFDNHSYEAFHDNIDGQKDRIKKRLRWYGECDGIIEGANLELKIKNGAVGYKFNRKLNPFNFNKGERFRFDHPEIRGLIPTLHNSYLRKYYASLEKDLRITVDSELKYYRFDPNGVCAVKPIVGHQIIIEVKYKLSSEDRVLDLLSGLPYRYSKNSKYAEGVIHTTGLII